MIETDINLFDVDDFLIAASLKFFTPENYIFIDFLLTLMNKIYSLAAKPEELIEKEGYIFYLQNVYTRSFEVFEYYNNILNSGDIFTFPEKLEEAVILIKNLVNIYLSCDKEKSIKENTTKKLANIVNDFFKPNIVQQRCIK